MNRKVFALIVLIPFAVLTAWSLVAAGLGGILGTAMTPGGSQVFADLVIALLLLLTFLAPHARAHGRNPWLCVTLTVCLGSFGPLLYFITGSVDADSATARVSNS